MTFPTRSTKDRISTSAFPDSALRDLLDLSLVGFYALRSDGSVAYVNSTCAEILGYTVEELLALPSFLDVVTEDDREMVRSKAGLRLTGTVRDEIYILHCIHHDGRIIEVEVHAAPASIEGKPGITGSLIDVSERRQREQDLVQSELRLNQAQKVAQLGSWELDLTTGRQRWSEHLFHIYGADPSREPSYRLFLERVHPDDQHWVSDRFRAALKGRQPFDHDLRIVRRDGEQRIIHARGELIRDSSGRATHLIGTSLDITERRAAEDRGDLLSHMVESSHELICITDLNDCFTFVNSAFLNSYGYSRDEILGQHLSLIDSPKNSKELRDEIEESTRRAGWSGELLNRRKDGSEFPISLATSQIRDSAGRVLGLVGVARDVTERIRAEESLRKSEEHFRSLIENASDIIAILSADGTILYNAPAIERVLGYRSERTVGKNIYDFVHDDDRDEIVEAVGRAFQSESAIEPVEGRFRHRDGSWRILESIGRRLNSDVSGNSIVVACRDTTQRHETEARLEYQAFHDSLTDLPNRALFNDRLEQAITHARRHEQRLAVFFVDLDHFKLINDTLGHSAGDELLCLVAARLEGCFRPGDTVARLGGDEFIILLPDVKSEDLVAAIARKMLDLFTRPFTVHEQELYVTGSVGVGLYPADGENVETLVKNADNAMYRAKEVGRDNYQFYTPVVHERTAARLAIKNDLRRALERQEFVLDYQPTVDLRTGKVTGAEALLRWNHQDRGPIGPTEFIPIAEEMGLILPIGEWVLRTSCRQVSRWRGQPGTSPDFRIAVNLSARQFQHASLRRSVDSVLSETGLEPDKLVLEITETVAMQNVETSIAVLKEFKKIGIRIALDDFGSGYSSLNYLKHLPLDLLKIDRSFISGLGKPRDNAIVKSIIDVAHSLRLSVVAEGVETSEQMSVLKSLDCDEMQGFHFSEAIAPDDFESRFIAAGDD